MNSPTCLPAKKMLLTTLAVFCLATAGTSYAQSVAGVIKKKEGTVEIVRAGKSMPAEIGSTVQPGDTVKTAKDSTVGLMLKDTSRMSLGPNSEMSLDKFGFNANTYSGNLLVSVVKGTFAMISGLVVKNNPANSMIKTPTSTAGIRGTTFVVEVP